MAGKGREVEFVVVGAGATGLSAAGALGRRGRDVVVCEKETVGHGRSGSKGSARIFRLGYDHPGYVRLAMVAERLWRELEAASGIAFLEMTGQVTFGHDLDVLEEAMAVAGAPYERMATGEVAERFPALSVEGDAVFEPESGVIAADTYLSALKATGGVECREDTLVTGIEDDGRTVRVVLETESGQEELRAGAVIVCAGPWTAPLVWGTGGNLRALATLEQVAYLAPVGGSGGSPVTEMPVFVERRRPWFYGLPVRGTGVVKISLHGAGPAVSLDDLGAIGEFGGARGTGGVDVPDPNLLAELLESARRILPGFDAEPVMTERCVYDNSPDGDFVVDRIGNIVIGSGTSGHGFKFAPLLGEVLADLAMGVAHDRALGEVNDLSRFGSHRLRSFGGADGPRVHP